MVKALVISILLVYASPALADSITLEKGALDEFSFIAGGSEQASLTTTGDFSVKGNVLTNTPTIDPHAATKKYVDDEIAGLGGVGGGSAFKPTWQGLTSVATTGQILSSDSSKYGYLGALERCQESYPGSRPMHVSDAPYVTADLYTQTENFWVHDDTSFHGSYSYSSTCNSWTYPSSHSSIRGTIYSHASKYITREVCNSTLKFACVKDLSVASNTDLLTVDGSGNLTATSFIGDGSGLTGVTGLWSQNGANAYYNSGNVGVGDSTPNGTLMLDVEGQIGAAEYCDENGANCTTPAAISAATSGDADTLDGINSSQFLRADTDDTSTGTLTVGGQFHWGNGAHKLAANDGYGNTHIDFAANNNVATKAGQPWQILVATDSAGGDMIFNTSNAAIGSIGDPITWQNVMILRDDLSVNMYGNVTTTGNITAAEPTASTHLTTKNYVDTAVAAAGGSSGPTYMGLTASTYTGNHGGLKAANALCASNYAGSRVMLSSDFHKISTDITAAEYARVHCDQVTFDGSYLYCANPGVTFGTASTNGPNCNYWRTASSSSTYKGLRYNGATDAWSAGTCDVAQKFHCVKD